MTLCLEKARRAWVRLPRPLHAALLELRDEHPRPVVFSTSQCVRFEPRLTDWKLTTTVEVPNDINGEPVRAEKLNWLGAAFAKHLPPLTNDKRTLPPLMPLADILAELPDAAFQWISTPPIQKHPGGILFEALGVLLPDFTGEVYRPSRELGLALEEVAFRSGGGAFRSDGPAHPLLSPTLTAALKLCMDGKGSPWRTGQIDGRVLRPLLDSDGAGIVELRTTYVTPGSTTEETHWTVPYNMRRIAKGLIDGHTDPFYLLALCPDDYQHWVANGLPIDTVPKHPRLLALLGLVKRKGKYDWTLTPVGRDIQPRVAAHLRAYLTGTGAVADDAAYDGGGVDIILPEDADNPWDILGEITGTVPDADARAFADADGFTIEPATPGAADTLAALDSLIAVAGDAAKIVQAPVPSNAELAAAKARREARHPVADLSLDDEFDIL
ncbi:hypothetical protein FANBOY_01040 [Brevundimonas phage vB_BgoS-Fanboy]|nr:hypothetical protein FANBOY_01040 [Brevundimonas phage vB_BgoS-Fanboy]